MSASGKGPPSRGGSGQGAPANSGGVGGIGGPGAVDSTRAVGGADEVDALDEVRAASAAEVAAVGGVERSGAAGKTDAVTEVAAALRAGRMTVAEAVDRLIEDAVGKQVGRAVEPGSELETRLRRVLRDHAGADPLISAKIRRLEGRRPGR